MDRCKCFLEQWMEALCNKDFVTLLQNKAKYDEYLKGFRLPQFGTWRTIQAEGSDDSIPDGLTKALTEFLCRSVFQRRRSVWHIRGDR